MGFNKDPEIARRLTKAEEVIFGYLDDIDTLFDMASRFEEKEKVFWTAAQEIINRVKTIIKVVDNNHIYWTTRIFPRRILDEKALQKNIFSIPTLREELDMINKE